MNAKTAKLINKFAVETKWRKRWVKRVWNDTPRQHRPELRRAMWVEVKVLPF